MRFSRVTNALTVTCLGIIGIMALTPPAACLLQDPGNEAELIVIVPDEFAAAVAPLEQLREGEGIETEIVLLSEVLSEFGGGCADTMAIRNFLLYAFENWRSMPRYILLAGDADSGGAEGPIPAPREITERNGLTPYDDWYVQLDADDLPDAAIGRIPMTNATDMASVVDKLVEYASVGPPGGENPIVTFLLTDSANISGVSQELIRWWGRHLAGDYAYAVADTVVLRSGTLIGDPPLSCTECMPAMVDAIDAGTLILHHIGVSSSDGSSWRDFIDIDEGGNFTVYDLSNAGRYPLVINSNCGTGRFTNNWTVSQELLSGADCGAIAVIAPTRNSDPNPAGYFAEDLYDELLLGKHTVGECLLLAKHRFGEDWGWLDWQAREMELFGDPSFSLPLPQDVPDPLTQLFVDFEINETGCQQNVLASSSNLSNPDSRARVRQGIIGDVAPNTGRRMYEVRAQAENPGTGCYAEWDVLDLISEGGLRISIDRLGVGEVTARYLRFWINVPSCPASGGFSVGGRLRSGDTLWSSTFALTDQYGRYLAPGGATGATDGWEERYIDLAPAMGDTLDSIVIGYQDVSGVAGQALAFVDGIEIRERWHGTDPTCHNLVLNASMGWDSDGDRVADAWGDSLLQPGERAADRTTHDSRTGISSAVIFNSDNADDIAVQAIACDMDTWHRLQYFLKYTTPTRVRATITEVSSDEVVASFRDSAGSDWTENVHWFKSSNTGRMHRLAFLPEQKRRPVLIDDVRVTTMDCLHSSVEVLGLGADSRDYAVMLEWAASYHRVVGEFHTSGWIDVYRSEDGGVNYEHVGSRHITAAWPTTQDCWFLDSGLPSGETFHYILRGGIGGEWGPVTGTPTHPPKTPPAVIIPPPGGGRAPCHITCPGSDSGDTHAIITVIDDDGVPIRDVPPGEVELRLVSTDGGTARLACCDDAGVVRSEEPTDISGVVLISLNSLCGWSDRGAVVVNLRGAEIADTAFICVRSPDLDGDGTVARGDLVLFSRYFGYPGGGPGDINADGVTDIADLRFLCEHYGHSCGRLDTTPVPNDLLAELGLPMPSGASVVPECYSLRQCTPNPFNPTTTIQFNVPDPGGHVTLSIHDAAGRLVSTPTDCDYGPGRHSVAWDSTDRTGGRVASGVYFCRMTAGGFRDSKKIVLLK